MKHTQEHFDILKATDGEENEDLLEDLSSKYDAIYIHPVSQKVSKVIRNHRISNEYIFPISVDISAIQIGSR